MRLASACASCLVPQCHHLADVHDAEKRHHREHEQRDRGTATEVGPELEAVYGLRAVRIPTNRPSRRGDHGARLYATQERKWEAVGDTIAKIFQRERVPEFVHDPARKFAGQSKLNEFPREQSLLIKGVWDLTRLGEEAIGC